MTHPLKGANRLKLGVFSANAPISGDTWTASCQYFRKCKFESYDETSTIWNQFSGTIVFHEIALP